MLPDKYRFPVLYACATDPDFTFADHAEDAESRIVAKHGQFDGNRRDNLARAVQKELDWLAEELKTGVNAPGSTA